MICWSSLTAGVAMTFNVYTQHLLFLEAVCYSCKQGQTNCLVLDCTC